MSFALNVGKSTETVNQVFYNNIEPHENSKKLYEPEAGVCRCHFITGTQTFQEITGRHIKWQNPWFHMTSPGLITYHFNTYDHIREVSVIQYGTIYKINRNDQKNLFSATAS